MVRVRVRLGYTMAICLVLQHQVAALFLPYNEIHFSICIYILTITRFQRFR